MQDPNGGPSSLSQTRRRAARWRSIEITELVITAPAQLTLIPDPPKPKQPTTAEKKAMTKERMEQRLIEVTDDAIAAYNDILGKPHGYLPKVTKIGIETRRANVKRVVDVAKRICTTLYGDSVITPTFWTQYFTECKHDPFKSGRGEYKNGHENWTPDFEYLTRPKIMTDVFEKAVSK